MKVWKKLQVVFLALLLCTGMMTQPALAASLLQDGIEAALTTDKETYQQGEEIKVTLTVTNTNDTAVTNLSLENVLPENFVLAENTETTKKMESLQAGETVTLTTVCTVKASDDKKDDENKENPSGDDKKNPTDNEKPGNGNVANDTKNPGTTTGSKDSGTTLTKDQGTGNAKQNGQSLKAEKLKSAPKMGDNTKIIVWVVLLVLAGAAIVVALKKKNRRNKMLAWFLCLIMTGSTVAGVFPERARAEAQSVNIGKVMELSKNILVDQTTVELKAKVEYTYVKSDDPSDDCRRDSMKDTAELFASLDALKARLDAHRPLPADIVSQIRQEMRMKQQSKSQRNMESCRHRISKIWSRISRFSIQMNRQHVNLRLIRQYMQWDSMEYIRMIRTVGRIGIVLHIKMKQQLQ